jgi:hypothetical protein
LVVTGPALAQNTSSLAVSGGINHQVELELVSDFTSDNDILIDEGGRIRLGGNLLMAGGNLMINVGGEITGYGLVDGPISGSLGLDGIDGSGNLYSHVGEFDATDFTANEVTVLSAGFSDLGTFIKVGDTANFGMINAPNGIFLNGASQLFGSGQVNGKVAATLGSQIIATDGDLILGDLDSFAGFFSAGEIYTNEFIVSIQDRNEAGLGTYTELGSSSLQLPGTLDITNGAVCDFGSVLAGWGTVESINNLDEAIVINGDVVGNSTSEPITFSGYVKGVGSFQNTNFDGTFAPGLSPGLVFGSNVAFGGDAVIEMEIGGPTAGIQHDKLVDVGSLTLGGMLRVQLINGYEPVSGDSFDLFDWHVLVGQFDSIDLSLSQLPQGLSWNVANISTDGTISVVTDVILGDVNQDGLVNLLDIQPFVGLLSNGGFLAEADTNQDGLVNLLDIEGFVDLLSGG